jgi:hypothetical protein
MFVTWLPRTYTLETPDLQHKAIELADADMASQLRPRPVLDGIDPIEEQRVSEAINTLRTLRSRTAITQIEVDNRIEDARGIIASINTTSFMTWSDRYDDQIFVISELQNLAYHEVDGGGIQDIAQWCIRQYLHLINQSREDSVEALSGVIDHHRITELG